MKTKGITARKKATKIISRDENKRKISKITGDEMLDIIKNKEKIARLQKEVKRLRLQMRTKENIVRSIIKKLNIKEPNSNLSRSLGRLNYEDLELLESKIK